MTVARKDTQHAISTRKGRCWYKGCRFTTWNEAALADHLVDPHGECSCGRWISAKAYFRHASHDPDCHPIWESVGG
jgi:hypothetical protein